MSGGSGITPCISIIREIIFQSTKPDNKTKLQRVLLVCVFKTSVHLTMLDLLLRATGTPSEFPHLDIKIEAFITQEKENPNANSQNKIQTIRIKPNPNGVSLSKTLGPNNWLWLGLTISSSFVMFLLSLGILTRYYIYPLEKRSGVTYNFSFMVMWDMFLVCVCVFLASSVVFLWQKRRNNNEMEGKQIQNVELPSPRTSPGSWFWGADQGEIESSPHQSLVQATDVHFGLRPDLKSKVLLDHMYVFLIISFIIYIKF